MRRIDMAIAAALSLASAAAAGSSETIRSNDPEDIKAIVAFEKHAAAITELDTLMPLFGDGAVIADLSAPGWLVGREAIHRALAPQFDAVKSIDPEFRSVSVASDGNFACAAMQVHLDGELKDGAKLVLTFRELDMFKKAGDRWLWMQQQVSYPIDRATGTMPMNAPWPVRPAKARDLPVFAPASVGAADAREEVAAWLQARVTATDVDRLVGMFDRSNALTVYGPYLPAESRTLAEVRRYYAPLLADVRHIEADSRDAAIDTDGSFAALVAQVKFKVTMKDGSNRELVLRHSDCLRRDNGRWRAFFEMVSAPVDLVTGRPVTAASEAAR